MVPENETSESADEEKKEKMFTTVLSDIYEAIGEIRYGSVQIHIQDGRVVQIDKVSKSRIR